MKFELINSEGKKISCEVILTFTDDKKNIKYIIYKDGTKDEFDNETILASRFVEKNKEYYINDIESEEEWDMIDEVLQKINIGGQND